MANSKHRKLWLGLFGIACLSFLILGLSFLSKLLPPERIIVTGKVADIDGNPLSGVKIHAVPLPVLVLEEPPTEESDGREVRSVTDKDGSYRLMGLAGRCGWKESSYIQPYHITFELSGYERKLIDFQKSERSEDSIISEQDIVLEKGMIKTSRDL